jgi:hypothetical protein
MRMQPSSPSNHSLLCAAALSGSRIWRSPHALANKVGLQDVVSSFFSTWRTLGIKGNQFSRFREQVINGRATCHKENWQNRKDKDGRLWYFLVVQDKPHLAAMIHTASSTMRIKNNGRRRGGTRCCAFVRLQPPQTLESRLNDQGRGSMKGEGQYRA